MRFGHTTTVAVTALTALAALGALSPGAAAAQSLCVETEHREASEPLFARTLATIGDGFQVVTDDGERDESLRWCESPGSPECHSGDEAPEGGLELAQQQPGRILSARAATTDFPRATSALPRPTALDHGARPGHPLGVDRPPAA